MFTAQGVIFISVVKQAVPHKLYENIKILTVALVFAPVVNLLLYGNELYQLQTS